MNDKVEAKLRVRAAKRDSEVGAQTKWPIDLHRLCSLVVLADCAQQPWQAKHLSQISQLITQTLVINQSTYHTNTCHKSVNLSHKHLSQISQLITQTPVTNQSTYHTNICHKSVNLSHKHCHRSVNLSHKHCHRSVNLSHKHLSQFNQLSTRTLVTNLST